MAADWSLLIPVGFIGFMVVLFTITLRGERRRYAALAAALAERGVQLDPDRRWMSGEMRGTYHGREFTLRHVKESKNGPWTTRVLVTHAAPGNVRFRVVREGIGARIAKAFGGQDHEVGDEAFDKAYRVTGEDADRAAFLLGEEVRAEMREKDVAKVEQAGGRMHVQLDGRVEDAGEVVTLVALGIRMAERLEATA